MSEQFDASYDLVVIGGGAAGKSAALEGARKGLSVALLEKEAATGGTSVYAEGTAAFESSEQKARGKAVDPATGAERDYPTKAEAFHRYKDYSHHRSNPDVARTCTQNAWESIDIYKDLGIKYTDVTIYAYDQPLELYSFHRPDGLGARCQDVLLKAVQDLGVDIFTSTRAKDLVMADGRVVGVLAQDADGNDLRVGAKAVVLATGGFGNNPDLVEKYSWLRRSAHHMDRACPPRTPATGWPWRPGPVPTPTTSVP